jgi:ferrous iron transport protein A
MPHRPSTRSRAAALPLRSLVVGERARILAIDADGELGRRIRDMGLVPGTELEVLHRAPLQDPVALRLRGFTLTLRNREADHIRVERLDG